MSLRCAHLETDQQAACKRRWLHPSTVNISDAHRMFSAPSCHTPASAVDESPHMASRRWSAQPAQSTLDRRQAIDRPGEDDRARRKKPIQFWPRPWQALSPLLSIFTGPVPTAHETGKHARRDRTRSVRRRSAVEGQQQVGVTINTADECKSLTNVSCLTGGRTERNWHALFLYRSLSTDR